MAIATKSPRVIIASDDAFELTTLSASLRLSGVSVVGEAANSLIAENLFASLIPDVVLIDLQFASADAIAISKRFRVVNAGLGVVLLTHCPDLRLLGLHEKDLPQGSQIILKRSVADLSVLADVINQSLDSATSHKTSWFDSHGSLHPDSFDTILAAFTNVQIETLRLLASGMSNAEIAKVRFVSEKSVEQIVARIAQHFNIAQDRKQNLRVVITGEYFKWIGAPRH